MIAWDHDDRSADAAQFLNSEIDNVSTGPIRVEQISRDQQQIDVFLNGDIDDGTKRLMDDVAIPPRVWISDITIEVQMYIGCV